ncbi:MAG: hypothetical protein Q9191_002267 [Dirinaria sp. TL-2023a]
MSPPSEHESHKKDPMHNNNLSAGSAGSADSVGLRNSTTPEYQVSSLVVLENGSGSPVIRSSTAPISTRGTFAVIPPKVERPWEYRLYEDDIVIDKVLEEIIGQYEVKYIVRFKDGHESTIPQSQLRSFRNADRALAHYEEHLSMEQSSSDEVVLAAARQRTQHPRRATTVAKASDVVSSSSDDELTRNKRRPGPPRRAGFSASWRRGRPPRPSETALESSSSEESDTPWKRATRKSTVKRSTRATSGHRPNYTEFPVTNEFESDSSSSSISGKRGRTRAKRSKTATLSRASGRGKAHTEATRRSSRVKKSLNMREIGEDDIREVVVDKTARKVVGIKEIFKILPKDDEFRLRHNQTCVTCEELGSEDKKGPLVFCQGCTSSYHQKCLGPRNQREHLVTKVGPDDFVLQCRRCLDVRRLRDPRVPRQGSCYECGTLGSVSNAFRTRQSTKEEQQARENNGGEDPSVDVSQHLINEPDNVLFRCVLCHRASHFQHLPPREKPSKVPDGISNKELAEQRFSEYCKDWYCDDCTSAPAEIDSLVAWRPRDINNYFVGLSADDVKAEDVEYLVKWKSLSYFKCVWMPGAWVWGVTSSAMRKAFAKRDEARQPKLSTEDAVPEEYLQVDIVFDVVYTNVVKVHDESVDKARIKEVKQTLVKFKGLDYEQVVWEAPPSPDDSARWAEFQNAYDDWVAARYIHIPEQRSLNERISKLRSEDFAEAVVMKSQPANLTGGSLMPYQMDGLNWLYYQWHKQQNAILADEMGLGKTIQVISFLSTLKLHGCWPFLIVVPNATCANWRREIKRWAPSLRVVTYFENAEARWLTYKYELFHGHSKDLKSHIVITSYEAAQKEAFRKVFRGVNWRGLVVDEGQRLKNDENLLYGSLSALQIPFKLLLSGTPMQNNPRELYNLLQFLDTSISAKGMEAEFSDLTKQSVSKLHEILRPFFLRRTKAQVLDFLPPMAQIIVPVTLTVLQKRLYKSILGKNRDLLKAIIGGEKRLLGKKEKAGLHNILMHLRKCLCHPFVYSRDIEEHTADESVAHRNLVDASAKLQLLEVMLPKLQERGHRVLIFTSFLGMLTILEDFLAALGFFYQRLDGSMDSSQKQKRIDEFNAPNSPLFAFLLSTRAGGVGINLATADTVIILDPDFNPHQDIQALSRAHRIGQKEKVLVFQLMTRSTVEEKIMRNGKKKMALDHVLIEQMDAQDDEGHDYESILRDSTQALLQDDTKDIHYDSASVDKLLDRSQMENTSTGTDRTAESQFSFARVWANDRAIMEDSMGEPASSVHTPDPSVWEKNWEKILKEREEEVAAEAATRFQVLGRGKRKRRVVNYNPKDKDDNDDNDDEDAMDAVDAQAESSSEYEERGNNDPHDSEGGSTGKVNAKELDSKKKKSRSRSQDKPHSTKKAKGFERVKTTTQTLPMPSYDGTGEGEQPAPCLTCQNHHAAGYCPLKLAGREHCPLCGLSHYGHQRTCPSLDSIPKCLAMLESLKGYLGPQRAVDSAKEYIVGVIGDLRRQQRQQADRVRQLNQQGRQGHQGPAMAPPNPTAASQPVTGFRAQGNSSSADANGNALSSLSTANANGGSDTGRGGTRLPVVEGAAEGAAEGATLPRGGGSSEHP